MATVREYFDTDFNYATRVHVRLPDTDLAGGEAALLYDFSAHTVFLALFIPGEKLGLGFFEKLLGTIEFGRSRVELAGKITLPSTRTFPGSLLVKNENPFEMRAQFHGMPDSISSTEVTASRRVFIYTETQLSDDELLALDRFAKEREILLQFRSVKHADARARFEMPLAFICHDSRDKEDVARPIALSLQKMLCPVWYDEFSLNVGDNLRTSIEKGLKECRKCVIILSENFFSNGGWTKKEFESIFTREILEEKNLILPVWKGVTKQQVYEYSPSLLNVKGVNWQLGEAEVVRQLFNVVMGRND